MQNLNTCVVKLKGKMMLILKYAYNLKFNRYYDRKKL
jgi:hypothetical protein